MDTPLITLVKNKRYTLIRKLMLSIVMQKCLCRKRKSFTCDFEKTDLKCQRERIQYWHISQKIYVEFLKHGHKERNKKPLSTKK